jgi:hypothetical protein
MISLKAVDRTFGVLGSRESSAALQNAAVSFLANLTTIHDGAAEALQTRVEDPSLVGLRVRRLVERFLEPPPASGPDGFEQFGSVLCNLSQLQEGRDLLRRRSTQVLPRLVLQLQSPNPVRRRGSAAAIRNCCYETADHDWLLHEILVVPHLLLPLAGPEELLPAERDGMDPLILKNLDRLGAEKAHEPDEETRRALLGALHLLCTSKISRQYMRRLRAYPLIRNLDTWEQSESLKDLCYSIVSFLIRDEEAGDNEDVLGPAPLAAGAAGSVDLPAGTLRDAADAEFLMKRDDIDPEASSAMNSVD